ncbi:MULTISPECIES: FAD binding domain-containing protein [unclassified Isoptericola]|uniref:FAD binding domain-containing protein n=1 Tax=unclassified Isoptericola TaxID=2623355 RepID=UPI0036682275
MITAPPRLLRPASVAAVSALLTSERPARPVAGGTDLLVQRRAGLDVPVLVDLTALAGAAPAAARTTDGGALRVSALRPLSDVSAALGDDVPPLAAAIREFASTTIRHRATIGGNLVTGSPAADTVPALLAADAVVEVVTPDGSGRAVPLAAFLLGPRRVDLAPGEWVASVTVPDPRPGVGALEGGFRKIGGRRAQAISLLSLAWQWRRDVDGRLADVRLAAGAVAPTVVRLARAEALLEGAVPTPALVEEATRAVATDISPIDDLRATAAYRRRCAAGLLREVVPVPGRAPTPISSTTSSTTTRGNDQ